MDDTPHPGCMQIRNIPTLAVFTVCFALLGLVAGGAWYMGDQNRGMSDVKTDLAQLKSDMISQHEVEVSANRDEQQKITSVDLRLARIEEKLAYLVDEKGGKK